MLRIATYYYFISSALSFVSQIILQQLISKKRNFNDSLEGV